MSAFSNPCIPSHTMSDSGARADTIAADIEVVAHASQIDITAVKNDGWSCEWDNEEESHDAAEEKSAETQQAAIADPKSRPVACTGSRCRAP